MTRSRPAAGFTLIEMVVVVALVGILAAAAHPIWTLAKRRSDEMLLHRNLRTLRTAIDAYKQAVAEHHIQADADASGYPSTLRVLVDGVADAQVKTRRIYFLRRMPRDPFADPAIADAETWGLRSYESPPDAPQPGRDVFDVYSLAEGSGLDGTPYRSW